MSKDIWISPDDYHGEDLLALGRCLCCGSLAHIQKIRKYKNYQFKYCSLECKAIVEKWVDKLED